MAFNMSWILKMVDLNKLKEVDLNKLAGLLQGKSLNMDSIMTLLDKAPVLFEAIKPSELANKLDHPVVIKTVESVVLKICEKSPHFRRQLARVMVVSTEGKTVLEEYLTSFIDEYTENLELNADMDEESIKEHIKKAWQEHISDIDPIIQEKVKSCISEEIYDKVEEYLLETADQRSTSSSPKNITFVSEEVDSSESIDIQIDNMSEDNEEAYIDEEDEECAETTEIETITDTNVAKF